MKPLDVLKLVLVLVALGIWAYGVRLHDRHVIYVAIAFVVAAFLVRFIPKIMRRP